MTQQHKANRLANATSPYLLQHQYNPVDWQEWGEEAFQQAQAENKPILLSVGYAACHWCHVMAHESFENTEIAGFMNAHFINIKLDREERPDIDALYQQALSVLGEAGGWPLTMFLRPNGQAFWGGTYFPPEERYGRPGFLTLLRAVSDSYAQEPDRIIHNSQAIQGYLQQMAQSRPGTRPDPALQQRMADRLLEEWDMEFGGFGRNEHAPKFPQPILLEFLWHQYCHQGDLRCRDAVLLTLDQLCLGGIYDHVGGGFARYATERRWLVPHFEKMLYDNACLIQILSLAQLDSPKALYASRVNQTIDWMASALRDPSGAFYSSYDADSEGEEGKYYCWDYAELEGMLTPTELALATSRYGASPAGNWEGKIILNQSHLITNPDAFNPDTPAQQALLRRLASLRKAHPLPTRDDKILADWNGLAIRALAIAATAFDRPDWLTLAEEAFAAICTLLGDKEGRLAHSYFKGRIKHQGLLDDFAAMGLASLQLFDITRKAHYYEQAIAWLAQLDQDYAHVDGGYYQALPEKLVHLPRPYHLRDQATPSGNGLMVEYLLRLYWQSGEEQYRSRAEAIIYAFAEEAQHNFLGQLHALDRISWLEQASIIGLSVPTSTDIATIYKLPTLAKAIHSLGDMAAFAKAGKDAERQGTALLCRGFTCYPLQADLQGLRGLALSHQPD